MARYDLGVVKGPKGDQGDQGSVGPKGEQGVQGAKGEIGAAGVVGPKGDKGAKGDTGAQGAQGIKGDTGAAGTNGAAGTSGKSAYQQAVEGGYTGTEAQFKEILSTGPWLPTSGGALTGYLVVPSIGVGDGGTYSTVQIRCSSEKLYLETPSGKRAPSFGGLGAPVEGSDAANKGYVDGKIQSGTSDPGGGASLTTGSMYLVYE